MQSRTLKILVSVAILLLIPLLAMQLTDEVNWNGLDFLVAGVLLTAAAVIVVQLFELVKKTPQRIMLSLVALAAFLMLWAELAVGIFGSPLAGS